jgi:hypothetical protein
MRKIYLLIVITTFLFSKVNVGENIPKFTIKNQFNKSHQIEEKTKKIIFVFSEENAHKVNSFLDKNKEDYLSSKNILFVTDISKIPSLLRWFLVDDLDKHKYSILLIDEEKVSKKYIDETRINKIMVVSLEKLRVTGLDYLSQIEELQNIVENN